MTDTRSNLVMVFDVETTGLFGKKNGDFYDLLTSPYILQLCFIIYDIKKNETIRTFNSYISIDDYVVIPPETTAIHGITKEICTTKGAKIENVLSEFYTEFLRCNTFVAHNIDYDRDMIIVEMTRNAIKMEIMGHKDTFIIFNSTYNYLHSKEMYCTMRSGKEVCNIWIEKNGKKLYKKKPKLSELYIKLFDEEPQGLHDALVDTTACLKCYLRLIDIVVYNNIHDIEICSRKK